MKLRDGSRTHWSDSLYIVTNSGQMDIIIQPVKVGPLSAFG